MSFYPEIFYLHFYPIEEACGLIVGLCGQLVGNHILLPISFESLSSLLDTYKDTVWESALKVIDPIFNTTLNMYILISLFEYIYIHIYIYMCVCGLIVVLFEDSFLLQGKCRSR